MANGNTVPEKQPLDMKIEEEALTGKKTTKMLEIFEEESIGEELTPLSMADFGKPTNSIELF